MVMITDDQQTTETVPNSRNERPQLLLLLFVLLCFKYNIL